MVCLPLLQQGSEGRSSGERDGLATRGSGQQEPVSLLLRLRRGTVGSSQGANEVRGREGGPVVFAEPRLGLVGAAGGGWDAARSLRGASRHFVVLRVGPKDVVQPPLPLLPAVREPHVGSGVPGTLGRAHA